MLLPHDDARAIAARTAIQTGDVAGLRALLEHHPEMATAWLGQECGGGTVQGRSLLHIVADWPGHVPNGPATVATLVGAGADVNARFRGGHSETPLHWAASCDDVAVLDALLDAGADIEAPGAVIGGGTPLADATAFGQWAAARRLVERGAVANVWESATLGLMGRLAAHLGADPAPASDEITQAFWGACHGGQREAAEMLLAHGADVNWRGWDGLTPLEAAERSEAAALVAWLEQRGATRSAAP